MWDRREAAAELTFWRKPIVDTDVALPSSRAFFEQANAKVVEADSGATVLHRVHSRRQRALRRLSVQRQCCAKRSVEIIEDVVESLGGSFSAEHGVGLSKLNTMRRPQRPVALDMMRKIKASTLTASLILATDP
jgi:FAD/FMN-containing dehydrogenase